MAKSTRGTSGEGKGPPDPKDRAAFRSWLAKQPRQWSVAIAARAALQVIPLLRGANHLSAIALSVFQATAIARFAAIYPYPAFVASAASAFAVYAYASPDEAARAAVYAAVRRAAESLHGIAASLIAGLSGAALGLFGALPQGWAWLKPLLAALGVVG